MTAMGNSSAGYRPRWANSRPRVDGCAGQGPLEMCLASRRRRSKPGEGRSVDLTLPTARYSPSSEEQQRQTAHLPSLPLPFAMLPPAGATHRPSALSGQARGSQLAAVTAGGSRFKPSSSDRLGELKTSSSSSSSTNKARSRCVTCHPLCRQSKPEVRESSGAGEARCAKGRAGRTSRLAGGPTGSSDLSARTRVTSARRDLVLLLPPPTPTVETDSKTGPLPSRTLAPLVAAAAASFFFPAGRRRRRLPLPPYQTTAPSPDAASSAR